MLKLLRTMKGDSADVAKLRAETYDEVLETEPVEYKLSDVRTLSVDATKQRWAYFPSGYKIVEGATIKEPVMTEWIPEKIGGEYPPVGTVIIRGRNSSLFKIGVWHRDGGFSYDDYGAVKLATARYINGIPFDGTTDITIYMGTPEVWKNFPIGFEYVQRRGRKTPSDMFGGGLWENVSSDYAGLFERIEGGNAAPFGGLAQNDAMREIQGSFKNPGLKPQLDYDGYYDAFSATSFFSGVTETAAEIGGYSVPLVTFKASAYLGSEAIDTEIRPVNNTVRVWRLMGY